MKYTKLQNNQQGIAHLALALIAIVVIAGVGGSGYAVYKSSHKPVSSNSTVKENKPAPAPVIVSVPVQSQNVSTSAQSTASTTPSKTATSTTPKAASSQPSPVVQYTSIPDWGVKVPLVSMTATNIGASLVVYDRLGITDANNKTEALFFGSSEDSLSEDEGCGAGQVASVYVFRDKTDSIDPSDAAKLTLYKSVAVAGHTYNIYRMLCHGGDWTLDYDTFNVADHLAQMVAS